MSAGGRLLLIDDDRSFRRSTAELLREAGYAVDTAAGGKEAGELLESEEYDLLLMDLRMPGLDGTRAAHGLSTARARRHWWRWWPPWPGGISVSGRRRP